MLPELVVPGTVIGAISAAAALATGIPEGMPLVAAAADKACEVIGAGALAPHIACLSYGTTATINTTSKKYIEVTPFIPPYPAAIPGAYSTEVQIFRGYWMVNWFKEQFGHLEQAAAKEQGMSPERSEEHTSELQSHSDIVCRLLLDKKKKGPMGALSHRHKPGTSRLGGPNRGL